MIFRKELKVIWTSPLPYVLGALFHSTLGALGWSQIAGRGQAVFQPLVPIAGFLLLLVAPVLASRTFAEEIKTGTLELLMSIPVSRMRLVTGKYFAVLVTMLAILAPMSLFAMLLFLYGHPDGGPIIAGLLGLALFSALLSSLGVLSSSLTSSQPVAAVGGLFSVLVLWFAHTGSDALAAGGLLQSLSISERLRGFAGGLIALGDVSFFVAVATIALAGAVVAVESRTWR